MLDLPQNRQVFPGQVNLLGLRRRNSARFHSSVPETDKADLSRGNLDSSTCTGHVRAVGNNAAWLDGLR